MCKQSLNKRSFLIFIILICILLLSSCQSKNDNKQEETSIKITENMDLSNLKDEELGNLNARITDELTNRGIIKRHLYAGKYDIGKDLPAGRYDVSVVDIYESNEGKKYTEYGVWKYNDKNERWDRTAYSTVREIGKKMSFTVENGDELWIYYGEVEIIDYSKP